MTDIRRNAAQDYDGPPDYRVVGRHALSPELGHDEIERINFLAQMNRHLAARVVPGVKAAYEARVLPLSTPGTVVRPTTGTKRARRCSPTRPSPPGRRSGG